MMMFCTLSQEIDANAGCIAATDRGNLALLSEEEEGELCIDREVCCKGAHPVGHGGG